MRLAIFERDPCFFQPVCGSEVPAGLVEIRHGDSIPMLCGNPSKAAVPSKRSACLSSPLENILLLMIKLQFPNQPDL